MKWKKYVLGLAIASMCYMPSLANSYEEAMSVTQDLGLAYTFYLGMYNSDLEAQMDSLPDWKKENRGLEISRDICYTRTLEDGTEEKFIIWGVRPGSYLKTFRISFYMKTPGEAAKVYYQTMAKLRRSYGNPVDHRSDTTGESASYYFNRGPNHTHDIYTISYVKKSNWVGVVRDRYTYEDSTEYKHMMWEKNRDKYGICGN